MKTNNPHDLVYRRHCCKCHLRNSPNCDYKNCSKEQYNHWLSEASKDIQEPKQ